MDWPRHATQLYYLLGGRGEVLRGCSEWGGAVNIVQHMVRQHSEPRAPGSFPPLGTLLVVCLGNRQVLEELPSGGMRSCSCAHFPVREAAWMALIHSVRSSGAAACRK